MVPLFDPIQLCDVGHSSFWKEKYFLVKCRLSFSVNAVVCVSCRSLCVDALIELSDENADWKLSFDEFLNCLRPGFNPPERSTIFPFLAFCCTNTNKSNTNSHTS